MNEELEALSEVKQQLIYYKEYAKEKLPTKAEQIDAACEEELNLIEAALKRSETLEEDFMSLTETNMELVQKLLRDRRKLKAFEIIKEKIQFEFLEEKEEGRTIQRYFVVGHRMFPVTQEEFDLLKEMLLCKI